MAANELPCLTKEQLESGLFQFHDDDGPVVEKPLVTALREVESSPLFWLWPGRIPLEKVTLLVGPPDGGKSFLAADLAARVSRGAAWPDCPDVEEQLGEVVYVFDSPESLNGAGPRLERAGADPANLHLLSGPLTKGIF